MKEKMTGLFLILTLVFSGCATQNNLTKEERATRKAQEDAQKQRMYESALSALNDREFVLEADRLYSRRGRTAYVTSTTNFIMVNGNRATVQIAFNNTVRPGPNGIGGITVEGLVSNVQTKTSKKGNIDYSFSVQGTGISAQVNISMAAGSDYATVTVNPNFSGNRFTMYGRIVPLEYSSVYKARPL